jgi:hypothetical protein
MKNRKIKKKITEAGSTQFVIRDEKTKSMFYREISCFQRKLSERVNFIVIVFRDGEELVIEFFSGKKDMDEKVIEAIESCLGGVDIHE